MRTLRDYSDLAQVVMALGTVAGVLTSIWLSVQALREVQTDRRLRQRPFLAFEPGPNGLRVEFVKAGKRIPGVDPRYVEKIFADLPVDAESVRLRRDSGADRQGIFWGRLKNYGLGPAIETRVTWVARQVTIGGESFAIDNAKLKESLYRTETNSMPALPGHISPNSEASLTRLPAFIEKDVNRKVDRVEGILSIHYHDVFGEHYDTIQDFSVFTLYGGYEGDQTPALNVVFSDVHGTTDK